LTFVDFKQGLNFESGFLMAKKNDMSALYFIGEH